MDALTKKAKSKGTTPEYEALLILRSAALSKDEQRYGFGSLVAALFADMHFDEDPFPKIWGGSVQIPDFGEE